MNLQRLNLIALRIVTVLSMIALLTVLSGYILPPHVPENDEGTRAHIFQLSIVALLPAILAFVATADRKQLWRNTRRLSFAAGTLLVAFAALFYLEHYRLVR
jgi:hypothetical protein